MTPQYRYEVDRIEFEDAARHKDDLQNALNFRSSNGWEFITSVTHLVYTYLTFRRDVEEITE